MSSKKNGIKTAALVIKFNSPRATKCAADVAEILTSHRIDVLIQKEYSHLGLPDCVKTASLETIRNTTDLVISLGGDGTLIEAVKITGENKIPVFGINLGGKGFLTDVSPEELDERLPEIIVGKFKTEERIRLKIKHHHSFDAKEQKQEEELAVNEIIVTKGALAKMIQLKLFINNKSVATYRGDGLIVSTPTGSTAYSMSAGGPILHPTQKTMLITPICPYTLTQRPFVVPAGFNLKLELVSPHRKAYATIDGRDGRLMHLGDILEVEVAQTPFRLVRSSSLNFFQVLRNKLSWAYEPPDNGNSE